MTTESTMSRYWKAKGVLVLLMCSILFCLRASGQTAVPQATSSVSTGLTHPASPAWGNLTASVITTNGDWLVQDFSNGTLYEFPADGSPMITLLAQGSLGGYQDPGFAIDSNNTLYLEGNWANCVLRFPYDPATKTWPDLASVNTAVSPNNATQNCPSQLTIIGNNYPYEYWPADLGSRYVQPKGMTTDSNNNLIVGTYDSGDSWIGLFPIAVTNGAASAGPIQVYLQHASGYTMSVALDKWGNLYFTENQSSNGDFPNPLPGVLMIPAGTTDLQTDIGLVRVDPGLPDVTAVTSDPEGNLYVSDGVKGVVMIPAATSAGALPQTANSVYLTSDAAQGNVSIDWARQILYVPTTTTQSNGQADVAKVRLGRLDLGSSATGTATAVTGVNYVFNGAVAPASFAIKEAGGTADFNIASGGSCSTSTTYAAGDNCTVNVQANPLAAGSVSAKLVMLDASKPPNVLATTSLHAIGLGSTVLIGPALESAIGSGFNTASQVAIDASGNTYVADSGLGKVLMYAKGSTSTTAGVSIGTGLTAPTGVAVDGAGDVFIGDSGNVIEVPYGSSGLNAAGQVTIKTGLGSNLQLAADGVGNLFVMDPSNGRVIKLGLAGATSGGLLSPEQDITGFTAPAAIAVDASNNAYVVDNQNLIELPQPTGMQATVVTSLGAATGLAFDPSGAAYATIAGGTVRIPNVGGVLTQSAQTMIATSVTNPTGIAIDKSGNVIIADQGAKSLHFVSINTSLAYGAVSSATAKNVLLQNIGNAPLTVTGFSSSDTQDFSVTGCTSAVTAGNTCDATVTLTPAPGVQGAITSTITVQGNLSNAPAINATGTGPALTVPGTTTISIASSANVVSIPVTVSVAAATGGAAPTGTVVITVDGANPTNATLSGGTVTVTLTAITAGSHTFAVKYVGDRTYGSATASTTATVAKGVVTFIIPSLPTYILNDTRGSAAPINETQFQIYDTNFAVTVNGVSGLPPTGNAGISSQTGNCGTSMLGSPTAGVVIFQPGCLPISTNQNSPNVVTPQTVTIMYGGDLNYLPATATTTTTGGPLTFNELRSPSVSLSPNPGSLTLSNGTGSAQFSVSSLLGYGVSTNAAYPASLNQQLNNYTLPISFACQGLPAYSSCSFSGGNYTDTNGVLHSDEFVIDTDPSKPVSVTVTIKTNISTSSNRSSSSPIAFAVLFGFGLIGLAARRKFGNIRLLALACILTLAGSTLGLTSCSSNNFQTESSTPVTPAGKVAVSITAQQVGSVIVTGTDGNPLPVYGILNQVSIPYTLQVTVQ